MEYFDHRLVRLKEGQADVTYAAAVPVETPPSSFFFFPPTEKVVPAVVMWLDNLSYASLTVLFVSLLLSAAVTWHQYSGRLRLDSMPRATLLLLGSLVGITALLLGQQQVANRAPSSSSMLAAVTYGKDGQAVIPNIIDPEAVDPQSICPGYKAVEVRETANGLTADLILAGAPCNIYGTDVDALHLLVEYQAVGRLHVEILPKYIGQENYTWFVLPEELIPKPPVEPGSDAFASESDIEFSWNNDPTFSFRIVRKSTGDVLFTTQCSQIVYEDQFIEFGSALPENYNLYGLGEVIHGFRLGNNFTRMCHILCGGVHLQAPDCHRDILRGGCRRCNRREYLRQSPLLPRHALLRSRRGNGGLELHSTCYRQIRAV